MSDVVIDRIRMLAWITAFMAPVATLEIGRELRAAWEHQNYTEPTPEFAKAMAAAEVASAADR